jgi:DNA-binding CsgD family transcriptional regulator
MSRGSFSSLPNDGRLSASLVYLTEVCFELGNEAIAAILYHKLLPWDGRNMVMGGGTGFWGSSGRYLGQLASVTGDWHRAERHFNSALAMNERMSARAQLAHTYHDLALLHLRRSWPGDSQTAATHLEKGLQLAEDLGLASLAEKITARRQETRPHVSNSVGPDNLTSREMDVLRLLAIGRTNGDIATALGISQSTVASHVHNILSKTGCDNRTEAAAYAGRHGIGFRRDGPRQTC